jgi:hypothetical protein
MAQKGKAWAAILLLMAGFNWLSLSHVAKAPAAKYNFFSVGQTAIKNEDI